MVDPIPDEDSLDLLTIIEFVLIEFLTLVVTLFLLSVAIKRADPVTSRPKILNSLPPLVYLNLSAVKISNPP